MLFIFLIDLVFPLVYVAVKYLPASSVMVVSFQK
jgi:hypothetical protein